MAEVEHIKRPAREALQKLTDHLKPEKKEGAKSRPLALISDSYDRTEVAKKLKERMGASIVLTGSLLAAADYDENIPLAALAYVNEDYRLAKTAASMRLLVQIYGHLRKSKNNSTFKEPLAVSIMFRDVLMEMEEKRGTQQELPEDSCAGAYAEEYGTVRNLWNVLLKEQREERRDRLAKYAKKINGSPIAYLHWGEKDAQIMEFLNAVPNKDLVKVYEAELEGNSEKLNDLWRGKEEGENPGIDTLAYPAQTLEEAALASQRLLYSWLNNRGKDDTIGVLAYDRQLVRRLHSLLLQDGIHLQDTAGWPANNLLVGKALLAMAASESDTKELLRKTQNIAARQQQLGRDWWKTPRYLAAGGGNREQGWASEIVSLEEKLEKITGFSTSEHSLGDWFDHLAEQAEGGVYKDFFVADDAAQSLRKLLRMVADEFNSLPKEKEDGGVPSDDYSIREIKRLLFDTLASTSLVPSNNESPIQLVQPGRFTTREFKQVLLAGADSSNLPLARAPQLFNDDVRKILGLPLIADQIAKQRKSLALMLGKTARIGAVWHGEAGRSPYVELMGKQQQASERLKPLERPWEKAVGGKAPPGHKASLSYGIKSTSVSSCVKLMECPYQYYASKVLRLREDRPQNIGERKDRYGTFVHEILEQFHRKLKGKTKNSDGKAPAEASSASLREIIDLATSQSPPIKTEEQLKGFKDIPKMSPEERRYFGWEFGHYVEAYVREIQDLYHGGGQIKAVEVELDGKLEDSGVELTAIADRVDECAGEDAIIDVKTGKPENYDDSREYPQLPLYIKLYEVKDFKGEIEKNKVSTRHTKFWTMYLKSGVIEMKKVDVDEVDEIASHMKRLLGVLEKASPANSVCLPANGVHKVCQYCSYGGLCRKKHWGR